MIGEDTFKDFCTAAHSGVVTALFITPTALARDEQHISMMNLMGAAGIEYQAVAKSRILSIPGGSAFLRIAHPYLDRELKGIEWDFIDGLEYLDAFEGSERIQQLLMSRVRP